MKLCSPAPSVFRGFARKVRSPQANPQSLIPSDLSAKHPKMVSAATQVVGLLEREGCLMSAGFRKWEAWWQPTFL